MNNDRQPAEDTARDLVVLVHGLWMHGTVFILQQHRLEGLGFAVRRFSYPSWRRGLDHNITLLAGFLAALPAPRIHLVCHSLGGLVGLLAAERLQDRRIRRIVLMGTPYGACHAGKWLAAHRVLSPLLGRSMAEWLDRPPRETPWPVEVGVLAGTRPWGLGSLIVRGLPQPNDGVIALAETRIPGAVDIIALPVSHSGMIFSAGCAAQAASFLQTGRFIHD